MSNDNTNRDSRDSGCCIGSSRNIGNVYYYTINGTEFEAVTEVEEITIAVTIGVGNKKENKED